MEKPLLIVGAGDNARLAKFFFEKDTQRRVAAFAVDRAYIKAPEFVGLPVVAFEDIAQSHPARDYDVFVAIGYSGMNDVRTAKYLAAKKMGYAIASYVSPHCTYLSQFPPGENAFILEDNTVQPYVKIGNNVVLWSGNHIGHDSVIGDNCFITSHVVISGNSRIGPSCFIGVNATLRNDIVLAAKTLVGAGAVLMKNTQEGDVYLPERARLFDKKSHEISL